MKLRRACCGVVLMAALAMAHAAHAEWSLTTADLKTEKGVGINEWSPKDGLSYTLAAGALKSTATRDIVSLTSDKPMAPASVKWMLKLRNGDVLMGAPIGLESGKLNFNVEDVGIIGVPLKLVSILQSTDNKTPTGDVPLDRDVVRFKNGDTLDGVFVGLADGKIQVQKDDTTTDVDLTRVDRLSLGGAIPARTMPPLSMRLTLLSGSVITTGSVSWKVGDAILKDYAGVDRPFKIDAIKSVDVLGGKVVWLTDLDPARTDETTIFGAKWPIQVNSNVMGGPLQINATDFARGLGVHTNSTVEYKLDGSFTQIGFSVGMDDTAAPHGQADVKVLVDGKTVWEQKGLKSGQPAVQQTIDIKDAHKVELVTTSPNTLDVLGRVDWVNVGLIRP